jgi:hypothetical protein
MAETIEEKDLYPSVELIEGLESNLIDREDAEFSREDDGIDAMSGIGELGRPQRKAAKKKQNTKRKANRLRSVRKAYSAGSQATAIKTGLTAGLTSKGEFELRRSQLPADIRKGLKEGRLQTVDTAIYTIKSIEDKSDIDLMEASDDKKSGKTNLNRAQLDSNKYMLLTAIVLEYAHGSSEEDNDPAVFEFGQSALPPEVINGTFEMTLGTKVILPEISCGMFDDTDTTKRKYLFRLANPKWLTPSMDITPKLSMPKAVSGDRVHHPAVKVTLIGTMTEKA